MRINILAITCWTGGKAEARMTDRMIKDVEAAAGLIDANLFFSVVGQGTTARIREAEEIVVAKNEGFAKGMNRAFREAPLKGQLTLCINNDIEAPDRSWLRELLNEIEFRRILCPTTNFTGVNEQRADKATQNKAFNHPAAPAVCWLMPQVITGILGQHLGVGTIFPEDLGGRAWGEDTYVAGFLRDVLDPKPFRIVPRAWIRHLGERTSRRIPVKERMKATKEAFKRLEAKPWSKK